MAAPRVKRLSLATLAEEVPPEVFRTAKVRDDGRHLRLVWVPAGRLIQIIFPKSPSDHRWLLNHRAEIRRAIRNATHD